MHGLNMVFMLVKKRYGPCLQHSWCQKQALLMHVHVMNNVSYITIFSFQQDFNRAIASWVSSGIRQKMEKDIKTSRAFQGHFQFWSPQEMLTNDPLTMGHAIPAFIILGLGLLPATITFMAELLVHLCNKKVTTKADNKIKKAWMP